MPSSSALVFFLKKVLKASGGTEEQEYAEVFTKGRYENKNLSEGGGGRGDLIPPFHRPWFSQLPQVVAPIPPN